MSGARHGVSLEANGRARVVSPKDVAEGGDNSRYFPYRLPRVPEELSVGLSDSSCCRGPEVGDSVHDSEGMSCASCDLDVPLAWGRSQGPARR